jgi:pimeloyl-ACP methyl ester carboxylesterase
MLSSRAQWLLNLPDLAEYTRPVVVELLGHARSPTPDEASAYTPERYCQEFEAIRTALGISSWLVCGQSLGAALTLRYSIDHPDRVIAQVFTNSNSALADEAWRERVLPIMAAQAERLRNDGTTALEQHPLNPARGKRLPATARDALIADYWLHTPEGIALTGLNTVPNSSVRDRAGGISVPTLLVAGKRETGFAEARRYAEDAIPGITIADLDAGHAVNLEAAAEFNDAVVRFFRARDGFG